MCGLFCYYKKRTLQIEDRTIDSIMEDLYLRGPDASGVYQDEKILLIQTRLKVIDPQSRSDQPFESKCGNYLVIFNGEIYNFKKIRERLEDKGVTFHTESDTEVLLECYIESGDSFVESLAGMFSFIIYDKRQGIAFAARDRLGIKPLYVSETEDGIIFSSLIKPILKFKNALVDRHSLWSYFNLRFTQGEQTMFAGIKEFPAGQCGIFKEGSKESQWSYWDLRNIEVKDETYSVEVFLEKIEEVLKEHNFTDASLGALLSGGIDSSFLVALSEKMGSSLSTYTFAFGMKNDEALKAKNIAGLLKLQNTVIEMKSETFESYREAIRMLEDPIADSIILPTSKLFEGISKDHKVALSGEGADEIFSGYVHQQFLSLESRLMSAMPDGISKLFGTLLGKVPLSVLEVFFPYPAKLGMRGKSKMVEHLNDASDEFARYMSLVGVFQDSVSRKIFVDDIVCPEEFKDYWESLGNLEYEDRIKRFDLRYWGKNYSLHRVEKLSMMHSLELRVPYFDHRIVELVLGTKSKNLSTFRDPKKYFRRCIESSGVKLQENVIWRKKQAFYMPTEKVYSKRMIVDAKENILDNAKKRDVYNFKELENLLHTKNLELLDSKQFQALYNFELWNQEFVD